MEISSEWSTICVRRSSPIFFLDVLELLDDDFVDFLLVGEYGAQFCDQRDGLAMFLHNLVALQTGQPLQAQVENRLGLQIAQCELAHQAFFGGFAVGGITNERDHRVEVVEGDAVAFQNMQPLFGLAQIVGGAPGHHFLAVIEEALERVFER